MGGFLRLELGLTVSDAWAPLIRVLVKGHQQKENKNVSCLTGRWNIR